LIFYLHPYRFSPDSAVFSEIPRFRFCARATWFPEFVNWSTFFGIGVSKQDTLPKLQCSAAWRTHNGRWDQFSLSIARPESPSPGCKFCPSTGLSGWLCGYLMKIFHILSSKNGKIWNQPGAVNIATKFGKFQKFLVADCRLHFLPFDKVIVWNFLVKNSRKIWIH